MPFSVLMSLYDKEDPENLDLSLKSVFSQTLPADEVVLVLDGPINSNLQSIVNKWSNVYSTLKVIPLPINQGLGAALNVGLKYCSYDLVVRMDTDDISKSNRFEIQVQFMTTHPEISVCSSWIEEFIGNIDNVKAIKKLPESHTDIYEYGKTRCPINHPASIFRKKAVLRVNGYGEFPEDYYLWGRLLVNGERFYNIQESLVWFRTSPEVYKRRGGYKYLIAISKLNRELQRIGYITYYQYVKTTFIRTFISLLPNSLRSWIYKRYLRK